jgi:arylsulfatase A-like enzyme
VDWSTGQILDTLKQLKADANTLVIFTSDNGGSVPHGSINQPLRGSKGETWEGGIREPTIAWWPGTIPAGTSTDAITSMMDFLPTLAAVAHAKLDPTRKIDGVNILSVLTGKGDSAPRQHFFYYRGALMEAVRQGPWKLHLVKKELYNLDQDIGESKDVAAEHPEEVQKLQALADTMRDDLGLNGFGPGCRPMGRVANPKPLIGQP